MIGRGQARWLFGLGCMDKVSRDLQTAGITIPDRPPTQGEAYLPVFAAASDTILASLGITGR